MKNLTILNIALIVDAIVVLTLVLFTVFDSAESDYTKLIFPITSLIGLFLIKMMQADKQKTLDQLSSVRVNKS